MRLSRVRYTRHALRIGCRSIGNLLLERNGDYVRVPGQQNSDKSYFADLTLYLVAFNYLIRAVSDIFVLVNKGFVVC